MHHVFNNSDLLATIASHMSFQDLAKLPKLCKAIHSALDWRSLQESRIKKFPVGTTKFVVHGNGWINGMRAVKLIRKSAKAKTVQILNGGRRKIHFSPTSGAEFVRYDSANYGHKARVIFPGDVYEEGMHQSEIESNNLYWSQNL